MVSTVHEHEFVQSRHPGCSFFWRAPSAPAALGHREGFGSFANHRSKNKAFFFFLFPFSSPLRFFFSFFLMRVRNLQTLCPSSPPPYKRTVVKTTLRSKTGVRKSKQDWLECCGNTALLYRWRVVKKKNKVEGIEVRSPVNGGKRGGQETNRMWCGPCRAFPKVPSKLKASLCSVGLKWTEKKTNKGGLGWRGTFWKSAGRRH